MRISEYIISNDEEDLNKIFIKNTGLVENSNWAQLAGWAKNSILYWPGKIYGME